MNVSLLCQKLSDLLFSIRNDLIYVSILSLVVSTACLIIYDDTLSSYGFSFEFSHFILLHTFNFIFYFTISFFVSRFNWRTPYYFKLKECNGLNKKLNFFVFLTLVVSSVFIKLFVFKEIEGSIFSNDFFVITDIYFNFVWHFVVFSILVLLFVETGLVIKGKENPLLSSEEEDEQEYFINLELLSNNCQVLLSQKEKLGEINFKNALKNNIYHTIVRGLDLINSFNQIDIKTKKEDVSKLIRLTNKIIEQNDISIKKLLDLEMIENKNTYTKLLEKTMIDIGNIDSKIDLDDIEIDLDNVESYRIKNEKNHAKSFGMVFILAL